jgi:prepilin-type N-terminal cleavage/methylation domain-containing protein
MKTLRSQGTWEGRKGGEVRGHSLFDDDGTGVASWSSTPMKRSQAGYTLMELLIVVILIGLVTALAVPQISEAIANNKVTDATNRTLIAVRAARSKASVDGSAMGVYVRSTEDNQLIRLDRSSDNTCSSLPDCDDDPPYDRKNCGVDWIDFRNSQWTRYGVRITSVTYNDEDSQVNPLVLCVQPSGSIFMKTGGVWTKVASTIDIAMDRTDDGSNSATVVRHIIVTASGMPRLTL